MKTSTATLASLMVAALVAAAPSGGAATDSLPNGTAISVEILSPADGAMFVTPAGVPIDVDVTGTADIGAQEPDATLVYVIDVSDSTSLPSNGACGNPNGDADIDTILDCELAAVSALNSDAVAQGSVDEVGVGVFGEGGAVADMSSAATDDAIANPASPEVDQVVDSAHYGFGHPHPSGIDLFTHRVVGGGATNFAAGLQAAGMVVDASTNSVNIVVFLSDGASNTGGADFPAALQALVDDGAVIHSFAVGSGASCAGGSAGTLQEMADRTTGTCTPVVDPATLPDILPGILVSVLDRVELGVDAGLPTPLAPSELEKALPLPGADTTLFSTVAADLGLGAHTLCATAVGQDGGGVGDVTDCVAISVAGSVPVDYHPNACPNPFNQRAQGVVSLAILGTPFYSVEDIDPTTVSILGVPAISWRVHDVATPLTGEPKSSQDCTFSGPDGEDDLIMKFDMAALAAAVGPQPVGSDVVLPVTGLFTGGASLLGHDFGLVVR